MSRYVLQTFKIKVIYDIILLEVFSMGSRMNKYYEEDEFVNTRYHKNEELYKEISKTELDNFEV